MSDYSKKYYRRYHPVVHCWIINNAQQSLIFATMADACEFMKIGKSTFKRHYISGKPVKSGWTIDKGEKVV